jgi:biopolymer transport protein ExbD
MRRALAKSQLRLVNEISVTPLVDLVLVLLLVFMITAPLLQQAGTLELPDSTTAEKLPPAHVLKLSINAQQEMRLADQATSLSTLPVLLAAHIKKQPDLGVLIHPHKELPVQLLVDLLDLLRRCQVRKTAIATSAPSP